MTKRFTFIFLLFLCANVSFAQFSLDWEMEKRFGVDVNLNGKIDIPNSFEYVHPDGFKTTIFLTGEGKALQRLQEADHLYHWVINGSGVSKEVNTQTPSVSVKLPQGEFSVSVAFGEQEVQGEVKVRDYLLVCMGDSFASGEGTPDLKYTKKNPSIWADGGLNGEQSIKHIQAHRSSLAWGPQAALFLENYDPRSSITFLFLAISGATVHEGILGPRKPIDKTFGKEPLESQLETLKKLVGERPIDQIWLSIGGNDLHFSSVATILTVSSSKNDKKYYEYINRAQHAIKTGQWEEGNFLVSLMGYTEDKRPGTDHLKEAFMELNNQLRSSVNVKEIYLLDYLFPITSGTITLDKIFSGLMIDPIESKSIIDTLSVPFRTLMKEAATSLGWHFVESRLFPEFANHTSERRMPHYPDAYKGNQWIHEGFFPTTYKDFCELILPRRVRWFRSEDESLIVQGGNVDRKRPTTLSTNGTLHPNEFGHQAYMHMLLSSISLPDYPDFSRFYQTTP